MDKANVNANGSGNKRTVKTVLRCAIYTRKSTDENLDSDFNSLDAQREAAELYIQSQASEGWAALPEHYDDGAYSGATMERPALKRLIADIEGDRIDILMVYKLDRLSRSLVDFAKMIEFLEERKVTLVSVTQSINTKDSSGRLLLNILLSYAQFEREVIAERIRDKVGAAKRRGKWMGGTPPLGYDIDRPNKRIVTNSDELPLVRHIFRRFLQLGSPIALIKELNAKGLTTKAWTTVKGEKRNGVPWNKSHIYRLLKNPVYVGRVRHKDKTYDGEHEAIIEKSLWDEVQKKLAENALAKGNRGRRKTEALLSGLLRCGHCQTAMGITFTKKRGRTYRYYLCMKANKSGYDTCPVRSVAAGEMENAVLGQLREVFRSPEIVARTHRCIEKSENENREKLAEEKERLGNELVVIKTDAAKLLPNDTSFAREELERLEEQREELEARLETVSIEFAYFTEHPASLDDVSGELSMLDNIWEHLFPAERERLVKLLIERVTVFEDRIEMELQPEGLLGIVDELKLKDGSEGEHGAQITH